MSSPISKCFIFFVNFIFWVTAGFLIFFSLYLLKDISDFESYPRLTYIIIPSVVFLSIGILLFITGFFGCCGAQTESKGCLFMVINHIESDWVDLVKNYSTGDPASTDFVNDIQTHLDCCGINSYEDWNNETVANWANARGHKDEVPSSCCKIPGDDCGNYTKSTLNIYTDGCISKMDSFLRTNIKYLFVAACVIASVQIESSFWIEFIAQVLLILFTLCLICKRKELPYVNLDGDFNGSNSSPGSRV